MTGQSVFSHRMMTNGATSEVIDNATSLPMHLRRLGYQTAAIGKMHFGPQRARHGFDEMIIPDDYYAEMERSGSLLQPMRHGLGQTELYPAMATVPEALTLTAWTAEQAVRYVRDRRDPTAPFFLWVSFSKPHPPLDPPEPYASMYRNAAIPEAIVADWRRSSACPPVFARRQAMQGYDVLRPEVLSAARAAYYGLVTQVDYSLGRVMAALQDVGLLDDCSILFTSDHGEFLGDQAAGAKTFFYEPSARVPLVLRLPRSRSERYAGTRSTALVTHCDVMATVLELAGAPEEELRSAPADGLSLLALLEGRAQARPVLEGAAYDRVIGGQHAAIYYARIEGPLKYIWYPEGAVEQLFNIDKDPNELSNLAEVPGMQPELRRLRSASVKSGHAQQLGVSNGDALCRRGLDERPLSYWRSLAWAGMHTERYAQDVRH